jgi:thiol-disulfide isomerase/thioredoxin
MNIKNIFTISLLIFAVASIVALTVKSLRKSPQSLAASERQNDGSLANWTVSPDLPIQDGVKVYYFHSNTRCTNCLNIEAYAHEAVENYFADELKNRKIVWQVINYETPGNAHYAKEYEIAFPIIVLSMFKDGKQVKWIGLKEVVDNIGDKATFTQLMQKSIQEFLEEP